MFHSTLNTRKPIASAPAVTLRDVRKVYGRGDGTVVALDGVSVGLAPGSFTALMGPSGSGKSTFLNVAAGLDRPTSGTVALADIELDRLSERRLTILRREADRVRISGVQPAAVAHRPSPTSYSRMSRPERSTLGPDGRCSRSCARSSTRTVAPW
jgi:ABC-type glutathione transport system ATPase component